MDEVSGAGVAHAAFQFAVDAFFVHRLDLGRAAAAALFSSSSGEGGSLYRVSFWASLCGAAAAAAVYFFLGWADRRRSMVWPAAVW